MHRGGSWPWLYDNFQEVDSVRDSVADILHENCADEFLLALRLWVGDGSCGGCTERRSGVVQGKSLCMDILGCYDNVRVWRLHQRRWKPLFVTLYQPLARASFPELTP
jgi:hypothetical protein